MTSDSSVQCDNAALDAALHSIGRRRSDVIGPNYRFAKLAKGFKTVSPN